MKQRHILFVAIFVTLMLLLVNKLFAYTQNNSQNGDNYNAGSIQQYEHEKDTFKCLLDLVCENRLGFELQWYSGEYTLYPLSTDDVSNFFQIADIMRELDIKSIIYHPESQQYHLPYTVRFSFGQTAIIYRLEEPDANEFGLWEALDEKNWYFVYYPYT